MDAPPPPRQSPPGGPAHLAFLDTARGIAILIVLLYHALDCAAGMNRLQWNGWWIDFAHTPRPLLLLLPICFGWISVAIFFAVSGFCIHLSHERPPGGGWSPFFQRRFFRIYPPYLLALCFFTFLFPLTRYGEFTWRHAAQFGSHLLLAHNADGRLVSGINPSFWAIAVEAQLYLLYPLLLLAAKRLGWTRALLLAGGIEGALRLADLWWHLPVLVNTSPFYYWLSWGVGAKLADDHLRGRPLFLLRWPLWPFVLATAATLFCAPLAAFSFPLTAFATVRIFAGCLARPGNPARPSRLTRSMAWLGGISYSLYLLHQPLLNAFMQAAKAALPHLPPLPLFGCGLAFCLLLVPAAWLFRQGAECKSIAWGKRIAQRRSRASTGVPAAYAK
ncbi:MAG: acyltransferase [Chthoniobacteraceae bacterium]|nr:acyltransferase [Chthoniobacteraceae bacterium]